MSDSDAATTTPCEADQTPLGRVAREPDDPPPVLRNAIATGPHDQTGAPTVGTKQHASVSSKRKRDHDRSPEDLSLLRILKTLTCICACLLILIIIMYCSCLVLAFLCLYLGYEQPLDLIPLVFWTIMWPLFFGSCFLLLLYPIYKKSGVLYSLSCFVLMFISVHFMIKALMVHLPVFDGKPMQSWLQLITDHDGLPQSFHGCDARIAPGQEDLFTTLVYRAQISTRESQFIDEWPSHVFKPSTFERIRQNGTLCSRGFGANTDLYGLGIRSGIYLQWVSALLSNNLLSYTKLEIQRLYLAFSLAVCLALSVASFTQTCTFAIEIEVLYWMYWGGYLIVFGTAPCQTQLANRTQWARLQWTTTIFYLTHMAMTYHGIWYAYYAYDQIFLRMPCGTFHFFVLPMLDPSRLFWSLRDTFMFFATPLAILVAILFPVVGALFIGALKHTMLKSALWQWFFPGHFVVDEERPESHEHENMVSTIPAHQETQQNESRGLLHHCVTFRDQIQRIYDVSFGTFSDILVPRWGGPYHGIRLITPLDVKNRRLYRITWAVLGLISCIISIIAIEMLLKWNKVVDVYSVTSTGQYFPLMVGIGSFISVIWSLIQQEAERRRKQRIHSGTEFGEDVELQTFSQTLSDAVSHAFSQPDAGFLSNDGAFPAGDSPEESGVGASDHADADGEADEPYGDFVMSGALPVNEDHVM